MPETKPSMIDASQCAFVCIVGLDGDMRMHSEAGYSKRQIAQILRLIADQTDIRADHAEEPALTPEDSATVRQGPTDA